jgi:starch phosphorylase
MKASMRTCAAQFSAARMVREYTRRLYVPVMQNGMHLEQNDFAAARSLAAWRSHIVQRWDSVRIESFQSEGGEKSVGSHLPVRARVRLGKVSPNEVVVQLYHGPIPRNGTLDTGEAVNMVCEDQQGDGAFEYSGAIPCQTSGQYAFGVRILPSHPDIPGHHDMSLIKWA